MNTDERIKAFKNAPYYRFLGIELVSMADGCSEVRLPFKEEFLHEYGLIQGGVIGSLADAACAAALLSVAGEEESIVGIAMTLNFIRAVKDELVARARVVHKGKKVGVVDCSVFSKGEVLVATMTNTFVVLGVGK